MRLLGNCFRSCAHNVCRWYQDYRNVEICSIRKQLLISDVVFHTMGIPGGERLCGAPNQLVTLPPVSVQRLTACLSICSEQKPRRNLGASVSTTFLFGRRLDIIRHQSNSKTTGRRFVLATARRSDIYIQVHTFSLYRPNRHLIDPHKQRLQPT